MIFMESNLTKDMATPVECEKEEDERPSASGEIETNVDDVLDRDGSCGPFQYLMQTLFIYLLLSIFYQQVLYYFIGNDPPWSCVRNDTSEFCEHNFGVDIKSDDSRFPKRCELSRGDWDYKTPKTYSFITEFDLVCDKTSVAALAGGIFFIGGGIGTFIGGILADLYGRKFVIIASLLLDFLFSLGSGFVSNAYQLTIVRAFLGGASMSCYSISFIYLSELTPPSYRTISANIFQLAIPLSALFIDLTAYYVRQWRQLQIYTSFPCIISIIGLFLLPRSPRWLLSVGKSSEAEDNLMKIRKFNGTRETAIRLKVSDKCSEKKYTYLDLIKNCQVTLLTLSLGFMWAVIAMVYYAISLESSNIGGNMYQAFAFSAIAEIPSNIISSYVCNRFGRRKSVLCSLVISGTFVGATAFIPTSFTHRYIFNLVLLISAKFFINVAFLGIFIWTFELYPTVIRSQGWAVCIVLERIGAFIAPFLTQVLQKVSFILPFIVMFAVTILSALAGLILPETNKLPTREKYDDFFPEKMEQHPPTNIGVSNHIDEGEV